MRFEPVCGQDLLRCADAWGHIFELDPQQESEFGHRKDAVAAVSKDDHLVPVLLDELPAPALPPDWVLPGVGLFTLQAIGGRQGEHQQGDHHVHPYGSPRFLRRMLQVPLLLGFLESSSSR